MASFVRPDKQPEQQPRLSKWEKADIRTERRARSSKHELLRENIADKLRCPLCFCLPCVIIVLILLILIGIYVVQPYIQGKWKIAVSEKYSRVFAFVRHSIFKTVNIFAICKEISKV